MSEQFSAKHTILVFQDLPFVGWVFLCVLIPTFCVVPVWMLGERVKNGFLGGFLQYFGTPIAFCIGIVFVADLYVNAKGLK
jgi:hypothetical protein